MKKVKIGSVIGFHIVYSLHASGICLAKPIAPDGEYVVWHIDCDGRGVWGGTYVKKLRNLPDAMRNCAWVFDLIPMEVSIVVEAGAERVEFPFFTFVQREGEAIMGDACVKKFHGYFPIRFN